VEFGVFGANLSEMIGLIVGLPFAVDPFAEPALIVAADDGRVERFRFVSDVGEQTLFPTHMGTDHFQEVHARFLFQVRESA
jgi:hypothetical protein